MYVYLSKVDQEDKSQSGHGDGNNNVGPRLGETLICKI